MGWRWLAVSAALFLPSLALAQQGASTPDSLPGGIYNPTQPTLGGGQSAPLQFDQNGNLLTSQGGKNSRFPNPWPVTKNDTTVTTGGTAQAVVASTPAHGWAVYNPNVGDDLYCSDSLTTTVGQGVAGSVRVAANGGGYETPITMAPAGPVWCVGATTGDAITARSW